MTPTLLHLPASPWSERARWALAAKGVAHDTEVHQPVLGEWRLRRLRTGPGPASVPVLVTDDGVLDDSTAIARWADAKGSGATLFPSGSEAEIAAIVALADSALAAGRARSLRRMAASAEALQDWVPAGLRWTGPLGRGLAWVGVTGLSRKYGATTDDAARTELLAALDGLRERLSRRPDAGGGVKYLLDDFSYADIAATQALAFVRPPAAGLRLGAGSRTAYSDPYVAAVSADLLAWRDAMYERHRA